MKYGMRFLKNLPIGRRVMVEVPPDKAKSMRTMATMITRMYGHKPAPDGRGLFKDRRYAFKYDYENGTLSIDVLPANVVKPWNE